MKACHLTRQTCLRPIFLFVLLFVLVLNLSAGRAQAQVNPVGGYVGPGPSVVSVTQAKSLSDDAKVTLRGYIIQHLGKHEYLFKDDTGTVNVKVGPECWRGQQVGPEDLVEIRGEVDKDLFEFEIDVDSLIKQ